MKFALSRSQKVKKGPAKATLVKVMNSYGTVPVFNYRVLKKSNIRSVWLWNLSVKVMQGSSCDFHLQICSFTRINKIWKRVCEAGAVIRRQFDRNRAGRLRLPTVKGYKQNFTKYDTL